MPSSVGVVIPGASSDDRDICGRNIVGYSPNQFIATKQQLMVHHLDVISKISRISILKALLLCWEKGQQSPIHDHSGL